MGQTILITGANRGIGLALTVELLKGGHRVLAATRNPEKAHELSKLREQHESSLEVLKMDVNSEESIEAEVAHAGALTDGLDVLVNNAAVFPEEGDESIFEMKLDHFREAFETNVLGVIRVTRAFVPLLEKGTNPRIVNISSGAGSVAAKNDHRCYAYAASKAALNMVTRAMAAEFRPRGICVVAMTPGWVKTEMGGPNAPLKPEESARAIARTITTLTMEKTSLFIERTGGEVKYGW
jgi:NAD(P)-dependent dehydrogenase (short-subunit alcohol dehydrogenase family)